MDGIAAAEWAELIVEAGGGPAAIERRARAVMTRGPAPLDRAGRAQQPRRRSVPSYPICLIEPDLHAPAPSVSLFLFMRARRLARSI